MADLSGRRPEDGPSVEEWLAPMFWAEDPVLREINEYLARDDVPIQVGPDGGRLLEVLCALTGARRVLELGALAGYSAIWMARALPNGGTVETVEIDPRRADTVRRFAGRAGVGERVHVHLGAALDVLPTLEGPYDLAFIDAVKTEYVAYLDELLRVMRPGGVICADNVRWGGRVADPRVTDADTEGLRVYLRRIAEDPRLLSTVVAVGDGLSVSVVRLRA